jgi:hypothetical protein
MSKTLLGWSFEKAPTLQTNRSGNLQKQRRGTQSLSFAFIAPWPLGSVVSGALGSVIPAFARMTGTKTRNNLCQGRKEKYSE